MTEIELREHTTDPIIMQLLADDSAINLSSVHHVELQMMNSKNKIYRYSSLDSPVYLAISDASNGKVTFTPPDGTVFLYTVSPYKLYIWVYTSSTVKYSVPESGEEGRIKIRKEF